MPVTSNLLFTNHPIQQLNRIRRRETHMSERKMVHSVLILFILVFCLTAVHRGSVKVFAQETDDTKAFKILKEKMKDPKTGLPKTLDPKLIKGEDREGYQVAKEIPEILIQLPCFCGCEAVGHENLLDCFVDEHGVG
jgi:hypothetical protein